MTLVLCYAALAVAVPALWICARLWAVRHANRANVDVPSAEVIHFPCDFRRYPPLD